jgi:hypothetical protein
MVMEVGNIEIYVVDALLEPISVRNLQLYLVAAE